MKLLPICFENTHKVWTGWALEAHVILTSRYRAILSARLAVNGVNVEVTAIG